MNRQLLHLVRHGEVHNPRGVLYGRLPGFRLSELGERTALAATAHLQDAGRDIGALYASPLLRAQQSARPIADAYNLRIINEPRIIEPTNAFEGDVKPSLKSALKNPKHWGKIWNPLLPSWGEPYLRIKNRALAAMRDAFAENESHDKDIVMVSHQAVIWAAHLAIAGKSLVHNPKNRRAELSSVTSFALVDGSFVEVDYASPAAELLENAKDVGAV